MGLPAAVVDEEQALRLRDGKRLQQQRIDEAEDRGVRADAERKRQDGDDRECRRSTQQPERIADISAQLVDDAQPEHLPAFVSPGVDAAKRDPRQSVSFVGGDAAADEIGTVQIDMQSHLVLHLAIEIACQTRRAHP